MGVLIAFDKLDFVINKIVDSLKALKAVNVLNYLTCFTFHKAF